MNKLIKILRHLGKFLVKKHNLGIIPDSNLLQTYMYYVFQLIALYYIQNILYLQKGLLLYLMTIHIIKIKRIMILIRLKFILMRMVK